MKTEINHCKKFDPKTFNLSDKCEKRVEMDKDVMEHASAVFILSQCMNVNRTKCKYYED